MTRTTALALAALTLVGCKDKPLEGKLKSCQIFIPFEAGNCTICGDAYMDGERLNTDNFTVYKSDKKYGYTEYDQLTAELCSDFFTNSELGMSGRLEPTTGCLEMGYTETDLFTFENGEVVDYNHDGSCTSFSAL